MRILIASLCISFLLFTSCKENKKTDAISENESIATTNTSSEKSMSEVKIFPIEHASAVVEWGEITMYIDPVGGAELYAAYPKPDLILITDIHGDHLNIETLDGLDTAGSKIIVPQAVADQLPVEFATQIDVLNNGDSKERYGVTIEAIPMYNLREEAKDFHVKGRGNGYVITLGSERLYFSGDTEDIPEMRALKNIDKAFICMNLPYTMTVDKAAEAALAFKPVQVYPYHFRGRPDVSDVSEFEALVNATNPSIEVVILDWYPNDPY